MGTRRQPVLLSTVLAAACLLPALSAHSQQLTSKVATPDSALTSELQLTKEPIIYTAAREYRPLAWLHGGERFPAGATLMIHEAAGDRKLVADFAATADANGSFDGKSIVFSGRHSKSDSWQLWELTLSDNKVKRLTQGPDDFIRPMYLPEDRIVYARKSGGRFLLQALSRGDGKVMPLTYAPGNYLPTDVLRDGRILFESTYPLGTDGAPEIYTVYSDGTGVEAYRCDHGPARFAGREMSSGDIVFPTGRGLARFTSPLAHQVVIQSRPGSYSGDIAETKSGDWLVSWRLNAKQTYRIDQWDRTNRTTKTTRPLLSDPRMNLVQPVVVTPRAIPNRHPSTLRDWTAANLLTLDAYTSKLLFRPGSIATVRVSTIDDAGKRRVLGSAPVEKDGSLYVHVPGDVPLQFELLDSAGKTLKKEAGWMWARKSEQRICVGCHAGPERAPDNVVPAVLLRSTIPADFTTPPVVPLKGGN